MMALSLPHLPSLLIFISCCYFALSLILSGNINDGVVPPPFLSPLFLFFSLSSFSSFFFSLHLFSSSLHLCFLLASFASYLHFFIILCNLIAIFCKSMHLYVCIHIALLFLCIIVIFFNILFKLCLRHFKPIL